MKTFGFLCILLLPGMLFAAPVSEQIFLDVAGSNKVYLEVSGQRADAPLLLYVHGGPGNVVLGVIPFKANIGGQLEKDFLVAYLHQRGAGKSSPIPDSTPQTFDDYIDDLDVVVNFLSEKYHQRKVHLVGHSVGGMLAVMYTGRHTDKVEKLVLVSTAMNVKSMLRDSYDATLDWAKKEKMTQAIEDLSRIDTKFGTWQDFRGLSQWANQAGGGITGRIDMEKFPSDQHIDRDYPDWRQRQSNSGRALSQELMNIDLDSVGSSLDIPALFVSGQRDTIVAERTVLRDYRNYKGKKQLVILKESHHLPFIDQPHALLQAIRQFLKQ